jgi:glutathione S-transferase
VQLNTAEKDFFWLTGARTALAIATLQRQHARQSRASRFSDQHRSAFMADVILHHYPQSPFSEKIRLILGHKKLAWRSVLIPRMMPKPDVVALTGGYRRTPFLQIGADIYCDTALIADQLEALSPTPSLYDAQNAAANLVLAQWADSSLFIATVSLIFQPALASKLFASTEEMQAFVADRTKLREGGVSRRPPVSEASALVETFAARLNKQLADGRGYLFGSQPLLADFCVYHPLWFLCRVSTQWHARHEHVAGWMSRMAAIGSGTSSEISSAQAIDIARSSKPAETQAASDDEAWKPGDRVEVMPTDYGLDPVAGELILCNREQIALRRIDDRAGRLVVHFPRVNYQIRKLAEQS